MSTVTDAGFRQVSRLGRLQMLDSSMCFKLTPRRASLTSCLAHAFLCAICTWMPHFEPVAGCYKFVMPAG